MTAIRLGHFGLGGDSQVSVMISTSDKYPITSTINQNINIKIKKKKLKIV